MVDSCTAGNPLSIVSRHEQVNICATCDNISVDSIKGDSDLLRGTDKVSVNRSGDNFDIIDGCVRWSRVSDLYFLSNSVKVLSVSINRNGNDIGRSVSGLRLLDIENVDIEISAASNG